MANLIVSPAGQQDGLDYGPSLIEIVVLDNDGETLAYRYSDDSIDVDWELGSVEDAVDAYIDVKESDDD